MSGRRSRGQKTKKLRFVDGGRGKEHQKMQLTADDKLRRIIVGD